MKRFLKAIVRAYRREEQIDAWAFRVRTVKLETLRRLQSSAMRLNSPAMFCEIQTMIDYEFPEGKV